MADPLLYPWPEDANAPQLAGSVFVNNTSYSGCDIKVVVNLYDQGVGIQKQITDLRDQLKSDQTELDKVETNIRKREITAFSSKPGTQGFHRAMSSRASLVARQARLKDSIVSTEDRLKTLNLQAPNLSTKTLAEAQTLAISIYRDKQAVRACGTVYPKAFTRGPREIAGSIIFTVFNEHVMHRFLEAHATDFDAVRFTTAILDQLPPVDITVSFANEFGAVSRMALYGVEFLTEGQTMSIEDLLTENVVSFVARDFDPMRAVGQRKIDESSYMLQQQMGKKASDLILEEDHQAFTQALDPFERFSRRRNPFV